MDATETRTEVSDGEMDRMLEVGNRAADVAGEVLRKYFRQRFDIIDKEDLSKRSPSPSLSLSLSLSVALSNGVKWIGFVGPVTIADREAEESMVSIILESFPSHAV